jgi:hypothetical protein
LVVIHFALEGHLRLIPRGDLDEIVSTSIPGSNPNKSKAARLHTFPLPDRFIEPGSQERDRTINIFAAIVMQEKAIIISDFSRMVRIHVISRNQSFMDFDIAVDTPVNIPVSTLDTMLIT